MDRVEKRPCETETEITVIQPQAKEHLEPPGAGGGKEGLFPRQHAPATLILNFRPPELCERKTSVVLRHQVCHNLLWQP